MTYGKVADSCQLCGRVITSQDTTRAENFGVQGKLIRFQQFHDSHGGDGFGYTGNPEQVIIINGGIIGGTDDSIGFYINELIVFGDGNGSTGDIIGGHKGFNRIIDGCDVLLIHIRRRIGSLTFCAAGCGKQDKDDQGKENLLHWFRFRGE